MGMGGGLGRSPGGGAGAGGPDAEGELGSAGTQWGVLGLWETVGLGGGIPVLGKWTKGSDGIGSEDGGDGFTEGTRAERQLTAGEGWLEHLGSQNGATGYH